MENEPKMITVETTKGQKVQIVPHEGEVVVDGETIKLTPTVFKNDQIREILMIEEKAKKERKKVI